MFRPENVKRHWDEVACKNIAAETFKEMIKNNEPTKKTALITICLFLNWPDFKNETTHS